MGNVLRFKDWHREKWWITFHPAKEAAPQTIQAIETWQWYKVPPGMVFDPQNPPKADKLEITGMVRLKDGREMGCDKLSTLQMPDFAEKVAWIGKECASRGIPVVRRK